MARTFTSIGTAPTRSSAGMSLIEVMAAVAIMVVACTTFVGYFAQQNQLRHNTLDREVATEIAKALAERIQSGDWSKLGTLPWSYARYANGGGHPAMQRSSATTVNDISQIGLAARGALPENIHVYLEWYRAIDGTTDTGATIAGEPGLFSSTTVTTGPEFRTYAFINPNDPFSYIKAAFRPGTSTATYDPTSTNSPTQALNDGAPIAARILVTWGKGANGNALPNRLELYVARGE